MTGQMKALTACLLLPLLAACATDPADAVRPYGPVRPAVQTIGAMHAVDFAPGQAALTTAEAAGAIAFLDRTGVQPGDPVALAPSVDASPLTEQRAAAVEAHLRAAGYRPYRVVSGDALDGGVRLVADRSVAVVPGCPDWSTPGGIVGASNLASPNFGCASAQALAAMVARPGDLSQGRVPGPAIAKNPEEEPEEPPNRLEEALSSLIKLTDR